MLHIPLLHAFGEHPSVPPILLFWTDTPISVSVVNPTIAIIIWNGAKFCHAASFPAIELPGVGAWGGESTKEGQNGYAKHSVAINEFPKQLTFRARLFKASLA